MGGRGAASGVSAAGKKYGTEYRTILTHDNIKFVQPQKEGSAPVPLETMSAGKNRVYAYVNNKMILKSIVFYDKDGKRTRQIDMSHEHDGLQPHVHIGYDTHSDYYIPLTERDKKYVEKVERLWKNRS